MASEIQVEYRFLDGNGDYIVPPLNSRYIVTKSDAVCVESENHVQQWVIRHWVVEAGVDA